MNPKPASPHAPSGTTRTSWRAIGIATLTTLPALGMFAESSPWPWLAAFVGRFHPMILHFPITLLLVVLVAEMALLIGPFKLREGGHDWSFIVPSILFAGALVATAAMTAGWLLMRSDDLTGPLVERHMQGGIAIAILAVACVLLRLLPAWAAYAPVRWVYRGLLVVMGGLIFRTSHDGGSLTHGEEYLTEYAPWTKKVVSYQFPTGPVADWDIYAHVVTPILETRCYECHRGKRFKGKLALDTYENLLRGGETGVALVPGRPEKSLLFTRMMLPPEHNEHMPPRRKPQPTREEMQLLRRWVTLGAPASGSLSSFMLDTNTLATIGRLPDLVKISAGAEITPELDPAAVEKLRAPLAAKVAELQARYAGVVAYESRQSTELRINASLLGSAFDDVAFAAFAPVAAQVTWCDLTGTKVSDRSASLLAAMKKLRVLRLARTAVTDATMPTVASLSELKSLSVFGTATTSAALPAFAKLRSLEHLYVGKTGISSDAPCPVALKGILVF